MKLMVWVYVKSDLTNGGHPSILGFNEPSWELERRAQSYSLMAHI